LLSHTSPDWIVYIIRLRDNSLYTGITNDLIRRLKEHRSGRGSKYVRSRLPITDVVYTELFRTKSEALKREIQIKKLKKKAKQSLV